MIRLFIYWEIERPWQIMIPILGGLSLIGVAYKIANHIFKQFEINEVYNITSIILVTIILTILFIYLFKEIIEKVEYRWNVTYKWEVIVILLVFSITGSASIAIGRPILKMIEVSLENLNAFVYYPLFIVFSFMFYQIFLVSFGWLFGQFSFFWNMEKKMLRRFGITI